MNRSAYDAMSTASFLAAIPFALLAFVPGAIAWAFFATGRALEREGMRRGMEGKR